MIKKGFFIYRAFLSPLVHSFGIFLNQGCRFSPSCGRYIETAVQKYGIITGLWMGVKRVIRCHPFNKGGIDEVP